MKKICVCGISALLALCSWAQPAKKGFLLSAEGNYSKTTSIDNMLNSEQTTEEKTIGLSLSIEHFAGERFSVGLGLTRYWDDESIETMTIVAGKRSASYWEFESNYWMPKLFCKYYFPVVQRFYLVPHLTGSFGKAKIEGFGVSASDLPDDQLIDLGPGSSTAAYGVMWDVKLFQAELAPEFVYFFAKRWGASFCPGGLRYDEVSGDLEDSEWTFSFKRRYWRLGLNFHF